MDSITHAALGACVGELVLGKKIGKKALLWGAVIQNLPDIDSAGALFYPADEALLIHRGLTHSLFFALGAGLLLALAAARPYQKQLISFSLFAFFFCGQLALHDLLDTCNSYGTALLEPFSHQRFSINLLYVADPLFTISLAVGALLLTFVQSSNRNRAKWALNAIGISLVYLCLAITSKLTVDSRVRNAFASQNIKPLKYFTTPTPLNSMLWYTVANTGKSYLTGYSSVWDEKSQLMSFTPHYQNGWLLRQATDQKIAANLKAFAAGYYTVTAKNDTGIFLNVLRFGEIHGWQNPDAGFVLSVPMATANDPELMLQKGRLAGWNKASVRIFLKRIAGN